MQYGYDKVSFLVAMLTPAEVCIYRLDPSVYLPSWSVRREMR